MKILLVNKFHYLKGGSEAIYFATKELLEKHGHQVICFSMKDPRNVPCGQEKHFVDNVDFSRTDNWFGKARRFIYCKEAGRRMEKLIAAEKPDIAHLHNISHQLTPAILPPLRKHKIPIIQTLHDLQLICPNYRLFTQGHICERCRKRRYYNCIIHCCVRDSFAMSALSALELTSCWLLKNYREKVDLFISPSRFLKEKLGSWGVKNEIKVINNFLNFEKYQPVFSVGDYVLFAGRLLPEKGIFALIEAGRRLPAIKFKIVGDGPCREQVKKILADERMENVEYLGCARNEELRRIISQAKFVVVASELHETYPTIALEAMALGKPVLASRLGGLPEIVQENQTGWFFEAGNSADLAEKVEQHFCDNAAIEKLGRQARQSVEQNNCSEKHYEKLISCYIELSGKKLNLG